MTTPMYDVTAAKVLDHYQLRLTFADGLVGDVDLSHLRDWSGIFSALTDPAFFFSQVAVDAELGTVVWPNGVDLAPEVLYERAAANPLPGSVAATG